MGKEQIAIETVDHYAAAHGLRHIDILKMDVQGWETEVLRGASSMLEDNRIRFVYAEVGFSRIDRDMQHFSELNDFLEERGFRLCGFYSPFRWGAHKAFLGFANALYVNPEFSTPQDS